MGGKAATGKKPSSTPGKPPAPEAPGKGGDLESCFAECDKLIKDAMEFCEKELYESAGINSIYAYNNIGKIIKILNKNQKNGREITDKDVLWINERIAKINEINYKIRDKLIESVESISDQKEPKSYQDRKTKTKKQSQAGKKKGNDDQPTFHNFGGY